MVRIITFNANGIRSALQKGFFQWFEKQDADILCIQELKAQLPDMPEEIRRLPGYQAHFHCAEKKGYSGCALYSRIPVRRWLTGIGLEEFDREGRFVAADIGACLVASAYFPSGTSGEERQEAKYRFLAAMEGYLEDLRRESREVILCGDLNIAHTEKDLCNWKGNLRHSGFLPREREWVTKMLEQYGWKDVFRMLDPRPGQYTWWSQRGRAREKNVGWRIDYQLATPSIAGCACGASVYSAEKFSDHAPLTVDYDMTSAQ